MTTSPGPVVPGPTRSGLCVDALAVAVHEHTEFLPPSAFGDVRLPAARLATAGGIPAEHLRVVVPQDPRSTAPDPCETVVGALGAPAAPQPLYLVRSGPLRDTTVVPLARLEHRTGWAGEGLGITHLDELGGTAVFDLLDWALPPGPGATVLVCDEPLFVDARVGVARSTAVGLRVRRGPGPLAVLGCGEGAPAAGAGRRFTGAGPCDAWVALHDALVAGEIADGDRLLLQARGPRREGWLAVVAQDVPALLRTGALVPSAAPA